MYCFSEEKVSSAPTAMPHALDVDNICQSQLPIFKDATKGASTRMYRAHDKGLLCQHFNFYLVICEVPPVSLPGIQATVL